MNIKHRTLRASLALLGAFLLQDATERLSAQTTAFYYSGQLEITNSLANGSFDLQFYVFDASSDGNIIAGPITNEATAVTNGEFTVQLDFGGGVFSGPPRWLQVAERTNGTDTPFLVLPPLQQVLSVPYATTALYASNLLGVVPAGQVAGTLSMAQLPGSLLVNGASFITLTNGMILGSNGLPLLVLPNQTVFSNDLITGNGGSRLTTQPPFGSDPLASTASYAGQYDTFAGVGAGYLNASGSQNTFVGSQAGYHNLFGDQDTYVGAFAGIFSTNAYHCTAIGAFAGDNLGNSTYCVYVGTDCGPEGPYAVCISNTANVMMGTGDGFNLTSGSFNSALGGAAGSSLTTGYENTLVGASAGEYLKTGSYNVLIGGGNTGGGSITNSNNVAVGYGALSSSSYSASANIAVGTSALLSDTTGNNNVGVGYLALEENSTGTRNVGVGQDALNANRTGSGNTAVGGLAIYQSTGGANTALGDLAGQTLAGGSENTFIGYQADVASGVASSVTYGTAIGAGATLGASHTIVLGTPAETVIAPNLVLATNGFASHATNFTATITAGFWTNTNAFNVTVDFTLGVTNLTLSNSAPYKIFGPCTAAGLYSRHLGPGWVFTNSPATFVISAE